MASTGKLPTTEEKDDYRGPTLFLLGVIVVGILVIVSAAYLLRRPVQTNPFDAPASSAAPAAPGR
jgi:hypothetical protein